MSDIQHIWQTRWDLIRHLHDKPPAARRRILEHLTGQYRYPVFFYIRRKGYPHDDAEDLTQGFILEVLNRDLFARANPQKGMFRKYLLGALEKFLAKQYTKANAISRKPPKPIVSIDTGLAAQLTDCDRFSSPEKAFDHAWVAELLERAMEDCRRHFQFSSDPDRQKYWDVFQDRVLRPILDGEPALPLREIAIRYDLPVKRLSGILVTVKRGIQRSLHGLVRQHTSSKEEAAQEMQDLLHMLE